MQVNDRLVSRICFIVAIAAVVLETGLMYEGAKDGDWRAYGEPWALYVALPFAAIGAVVRYRSRVVSWWRRRRSRRPR